MKTLIKIESIGRIAKIIFDNSNDTETQYNMFINLKWLTQEGNSEDSNYFFCKKSKLRKAIKYYINALGECPFKFERKVSHVYEKSDLTFDTYRQGEYQDSTEVWQGYRPSLTKYFDKVES